MNEFFAERVDGKLRVMLGPHRAKRVTPPNQTRLRKMPEAIDLFPDHPAPESGSMLERVALPGIKLTPAQRAFKPFAARILDLPETAEATFAFDKPSGDLLSLRLQDGEKLNVLVQISDWKVSLDPASPIAWEGVTDIPEGERVSLSHLVT